MTPQAQAMLRDLEGARHFAASLHTLATIAESNARCAQDPRLADAYVALAADVMDAANELRIRADSVEGIWALPLEPA